MGASLGGEVLCRSGGVRNISAAGDIVAVSLSPSPARRIELLSGLDALSS